MARLIYGPLTSLDGYIEDSGGSFDWAEPDEEVHTFINQRSREIGAFLLGRRMYETLQVWETGFDGPEMPAYLREFAGIWRNADKVVYSRTLTDVTTARTRVEREFDAAAVRRLKAESQRDLAIGGPELAAQALRAGLVDELEPFVVPVAVGGGKPALPHGLRLDLELVEERRFASGILFLRYRLR